MHFIIDDSNVQFRDLVCSNLENRGLDWIMLSDDNAQAPDLKDKHLIVTSESKNVDISIECQRIN